ncbi:MAG: hypothetical protein ACYSW8_31530, partial [Planctomycetota bacterium]
MAETEGRRAQDIGQDEAYTVDLKEVVSAERDTAGRNRVLFDALACNVVTSIAAINAQIVRQVEQGATTSGKNAENTIGVNETDHVVGQILNSPWAEAMKTLMVEVM